MPTADRYREAALRFAALAENMRREAALVAGWRLEGQIGPGPVADAVTERLAWAAGDLQASAEELARLSRTCAARAAACDEYRREVSWWLGAPITERGLAPYPSRPHPWISL